MATGILVTYSGYPYTPSSFFPDNGLANLAGALLAGGHGVRILDFSTLSTFERFMTPELRGELRELLPHFMQPPKDPEVLGRFARAEQKLHAHQQVIVRQIGDEILAEVDKLKADWVGFKLYLGDGFEGSLTMAELLKQQRPRLKLFAGGPLVDLFKEHVLRRAPVFDALVYAEAENMIVDLADYTEGKKSLAQIPNVIFRGASGTVTNPLEREDDLDRLPFPCYERDVYPALHSSGKLRIITFDESRGCPYRCAFCIHADKSGLKLRKKSVDRMVAELKGLMKTCDTKVFRFAGSATPYRLLAELGERLISEKMELMYSIYGVAHHLDPTVLPLLKKSGLWAIFYGVESADSRILEGSMAKRNNAPEKMKEILRATLDAGIFTVASVIYPAPHETEESTQNTFEFLKDVFKGRSGCSVPITFAGLFPTTEWMNDRARFGFEIPDVDSFMASAMNYKIKSLLPYWLWPDVPYKLNGKGGAQLQAEASSMIRRLEAEGITTMLLDDSAMIGALAEYDLKSYRREVAAAFYSGDVGYVTGLLDKVNRAASVPSAGGDGA